MLTLFRNFFKSKIGIVVTLAFLGLIAFAFASSDVANNATFGGVSGGDRVAIVGDRKIGAAELRLNLSNALEQARQNDPRLTMQVFLDNGGLEGVLSRTLERSALAEFGRIHGMRSGNRLVDSEILQISAFRGFNGEFDQETFRAALQQQGLTEAAVREDLAMGLFARQIVTPISLEGRVPGELVRRYATLLREQRKGEIAILPSEAFAPKGEPTSQQLQDFYQETRDDYIRPERRVIRYAAFGEDALDGLRDPTEAEIRARYDRDIEQYAASEERSFSQLVVASQADAEAIAEEVRNGRTLAQSAQQRGLATTSLVLVTQEELASSVSEEVAQAAFAAGQGEVAQPARGDLGWYVLRVERIETTDERSFDEVREEISTALAAEQKQAAFADLTVRIEDELADGRSLGEVARELGVEVSTTPPVTADGNIYGQAGASVPPALRPVVPVAFEMDEGEPQLAEIVPGTAYLVFDVPEITPSEAAPLTEIRGQVAALWRRNEGAKAARAAADRAMSAAGEDRTLQQAIRDEDTPLPPVDAVDLSRVQIQQQGQVPPVLALLFSMAEGTVKKLEMQADAGWFVVKLDDIEPGDVADDDPIIAATTGQLGQVASEEYIQQFLVAVQREVEVERNQVAIDAVVAQLTGTAN